MVHNFVSKDPLKLVSKPLERGLNCEQNGPKTVKNAVLLTKLWTNKVWDQQYTIFNSACPDSYQEIYATILMEQRFL